MAMLEPQADPTTPPLEIGLVNNMPDAALQATERQFRAWLEAAAGPRPIRLRLYHMDGVPRGEVARRILARGYQPLDTLPGRLDALIITGAEPLANRLQDEPYWGALAQLVTWAEANTGAALFSCLAAHAAVLRLDGIARRRLPTKCSGVFDFDRVGAHTLTEGVEAVSTPHSRHNGLDALELAACGYRLLTCNPAVGVDAFVRDGASRMLFLQGHPEYDADALRLEYRRDLRRWLGGEQPSAPKPPVAAFDAATTARLQALAAGAAHPDRYSEFAELMAAPRGEAHWRAPWNRILSNWLEAAATPLAQAHPAA